MLGLFKLHGMEFPPGLVGIPLRYMHTPSEVIDLNDLEAVVQLLVAFARSLRKGRGF